jgi:hypothetical protein
MRHRILFAGALAVFALACSKKDETADAAPEAAAPVVAAADAAPAAAEAGAAPTTAVKTVVAVKPTATVAKANTCANASQAAFVGGGGSKECHATCNTNTDCSKNAPGTKCTGNGTLMTPEGTRGGSMKFCQ